MSTKIMNPILTGFNPDPSICYVDGVYYIANSTFQWFPGVQISASTDLVNWEVVSRPLNRTSLLDMKGNPTSGGIWAPCLTYSKGLFHLIYTDVKFWANEQPFKDAPNYYTTCATIDGEWSEPVYMNSSGFDASLFHDDDGKVWYMNMEWDYRKEGNDRFAGIVIQEFDYEKKKLVGDIHKIYLGTPIGLTEGPHIYKKDGYYYLLTAEGGTTYEHAATIARSKHVLGPYETHPDNPFITSHNKDVYIKKAGHGSLCVNDNGEWFFAHLCGRPLPGTKRCVLGRETAIQRVTWENDWPYIVGENGITNTPQDYIVIEDDIEKITKEYKYTFNDEAFLRDFNSLRIPIGEKMSLTDREGYLRMYGRESLASCHEQSILARRQKDFAFNAETKLQCNPESFLHMAGLSYRYDEDNQYFFRVSYDEETKEYMLGLITLDHGGYALEEVQIDYKGEIVLGVEVDYRDVKFYYQLEDERIDFPGVYDASILSDDYVLPMGFTGAFVGMQVIDMRHHEFYADFEYFNYEPIEK